MEAMSCDQLSQKKCLPCEGGVAPYTSEQAIAQLEKLEGWKLTPDGQRIRKDWTTKNFMAGIDFLTRWRKLPKKTDTTRICTSQATAMFR